MESRPKNLNVLFGLSVFGHFLYLTLLAVFVRQIPESVLQLTPLKVTPIPIYATVIIIGHLFAFYLQERHPRATMVLYVAMVYTALVLGLIMGRLSTINYAN